MIRTEPYKVAPGQTLRSEQKSTRLKNEKELNTFLGAVQYLYKYIDEMSAETADGLKELLKRKPAGYGQRTHSRVQELKNINHGDTVSIDITISSRTSQQQMLV